MLNTVVANATANSLKTADVNDTNNHQRLKLEYTGLVKKDIDK